MTPRSETQIERRISRLQKILYRAMCTDRLACGRRIKRLPRHTSGGCTPENTLKELDKIEARLHASIERKKNRRRLKPPVAFPENLPITDKKNEIISALHSHQVLIVSGETGCGKSTQLPKMCMAANRGIDGKIGCTQPRRIAAAAVCNRIAEELGEKTGGSVGYRIRFTDRTHPQGYIKVMTDGILLAEAQRDRMLSEYDTLIVDEAHERSLNIDFLLGMLRRLAGRRPDLKIIITSATMDTEKFSAAFRDAPVIEVEGRMFPVEIRYRPPDRDAGEQQDWTFVDDALDAVTELLDETRSGDILVFMPTEADIMETCERIDGIRRETDLVLPLFARLSAADQKKVFASGRKRKVIVSTNVAETSLTIPGISYVVDTGLARIPRYVPRTRTTIMPVVPISRGSADQRKGRCGRVRGGVCIRLYSEEDYESRPRFTPPEIQRANLAEVILKMLSLKLGDVGNFPFIDPPTKRSVSDGFKLLGELGAVSGAEGRLFLTDRGRVMARMPLDPRISRMILEACEEGCMAEIAVIAAALSIQDPRERPTRKTSEADRRHSAFVHPESDFLTLFNIFRACSRIIRVHGKNRLRAFCRENYLSYPRVCEWQDIQKQITAIVEEQKLKIASRQPVEAENRYAAVHRAVLSGYLTNIAQKKGKNSYLSSRGREVMLFPGSALFNRCPEWIVAAEIVKTSRLYARTAARIDPQWLEALGGNLCSRTYLNPHWEKNRGEVRAVEQVSLYGLIISSGRSVSYQKIDPQTCRKLFIQALVEGELKPQPGFLKHNLKLAQQMLALEDKLRRRDIFAGQGAAENFYDSRLPGICDSRSLAKLIKKRHGDAFLRMNEQDLLVRYPDRQELAGFPDSVSHEGMELKCTYTFSPGGEQDGVTLSVPLAMAGRFPASRLDWVVPGLLEEKVTALIKGLPKRYRKDLVPVSRTVKTVLPAVERRKDKSLIAALARAVHEFFHVQIPARAWQDVNIPDHLKIRLSIKDDKGLEITAGRDPSVLSAASEMTSTNTHDPPELSYAKNNWERTGIKGWDFGDLPERVSIKKYGFAYPALVPEEDGPAVRLFTDPTEAARIHPQGVKSLFRRVMKKDLKFIGKSLETFSANKDIAIPSIPKSALERGIHDYLISPFAKGNIRTCEAFKNGLALARSELMNRAKAALQTTEQVLDAYSQTVDVLASIRRSNQSNPAVLEMLEEIYRELDDIVPHDFLALYDYARIESLPRYLKAMQIRAERGSHDINKDTGKKARVKKYIDALRHQCGQLSADSSEEKRTALEKFRWMIEEFKISLFAQEIKTIRPVSAKRLDNMLKELERLL